MGESGNDIIIKGSSVELTFDGTLYEKDPNDPKVHRNSTKKITRIVITGDINYDSGEHPGGLRCEVKAVCR
jgi:hypothetical protein